MSSLLSPMMTKQQLALELNVCEQTIGIFLKKYPAMPRPVKIGGRLYWERLAIEDWVRGFLPSRSRAGAA